MNQVVEHRHLKERIHVRAPNALCTGCDTQALDLRSVLVWIAALSPLAFAVSTGFPLVRLLGLVCGALIAVPAVTSHLFHLALFEMSGSVVQQATRLPDVGTTSFPWPWYEPGAVSTDGDAALLWHATVLILAWSLVCLSAARLRQNLLGL